MAHSLSNSQARSVARNKLLHALKKSKVLAGILPIWQGEYDNFEKEILKSKIEWLQPGDLTEIILYCFVELPETLRKDGPLVDSLNEEQITMLVDRVLQLLEEPGGYWFKFPLPQIELDDDVQLSEHVWLTKFNNDSISSIPLGTLPFNGGASLKVFGSGYVTQKRNQSAFVDAIRKLRWTLHLAAMNRFTTLKPKMKSGLALALGGQNSSDIFEISYECDRPNPLAISRLTLGIGLSKYLSELSFTDGEWAKTKNASLQAHLGQPLSMLSDPIAEDNVASIRRSLEWAFDSRIDEDEHMRFMKTCIGLEAAIAEQAEDVGITEQLADRCAFILDRTPTAREETRVLMRKIYKLRSKLVHGAANRLSGEDRALADRAESILDLVLNLEINAVMSWYTKLGSKSN